MDKQTLFNTHIQAAYAIASYFISSALKALYPQLNPIDYILYRFSSIETHSQLNVNNNGHANYSILISRLPMPQHLFYQFSFKGTVSSAKSNRYILYRVSSIETHSQVNVNNNGQTDFIQYSYLDCLASNQSSFKGTASVAKSNRYILSKVSTIRDLFPGESLMIMDRQALFNIQYSQQDHRRI